MKKEYDSPEFEYLIIRTESIMDYVSDPGDGGHGGGGANGGFGDGEE